MDNNVFTHAWWFFVFHVKDFGSLLIAGGWYVRGFYSLLLLWEGVVSIPVGGTHSAHRGNGLCLPTCPILHFALVERLDLRYVAAEGLLHALLQQPALALTLRVFQVRDGLQGCVQVLQPRCHSHLEAGGRNYITDHADALIATSRQTSQLML